MNDGHDELLRFWLIEPALVLAPLSIPMGRMLGRRLQIKRLFWVLTILLISVGALCFTAFSPWSLRSAIANTALGSASYLIAMVLLFALVSLPSRRWIRRSFYAVLLIPVLISFFLGTVGFLGVMFSIQTPARTGMLTETYGYQIFFTGGRYTSHNYADVVIMYYPKYFPLKKEIWSQSLDFRAFDYSKNEIKVSISPNHQRFFVRALKRDGNEQVEQLKLSK